MGFSFSARLIGRMPYCRLIHYSINETEKYEIFLLICNQPSKKSRLFLCGMTVLFSKVKIRKIEGREIVLRRLGAADELEAAVLFQQNLRGMELAIIIVAH